MVNRNLLIGKVSPFVGKKEIVVANQDTVDIIDALIKNHYKYSNEYDKIYKYFDGGNVEETAYNVWYFLKEDFKYTIEPEKMQILRSPAAILASNIVGIDCKGYATFSNGIMDAYRRNTGKKFEVYYRFASYDPNDSTPQHVFSVVKENNVEYWIDPVLDQFDEKKQPYYYKDKKIKNMALVAMSGIPTISGFDNNSNQVDQMGGFFDFLDSTGDSGGDSGGWLNTILKSAPSIISAFNPTPSSSSNQNPTDNTAALLLAMQKNQQTQNSGLSNNNMILIGAAGIAVILLLTMNRK